MMPKISIFAHRKKEIKSMTQKEAIIKVLENYGGRAKLTDIYPHVIKMAEFKPDSDKKATIRTTLQRNPQYFRQSKGKKGSWELVSYQEEIASRDKRIKELEEDNARLKSVKTEDDFVARFVKKVKHNLKRDKKTVEEIRKLMDALGRPDADKELDDWLQGKDKKVVKQVTKKYIQKNINSQVFTGSITESEFNGGGSDNEE
jgi:hypothetical protein